MLPKLYSLTSVFLKIFYICGIMFGNYKYRPTLQSKLKNNIPTNMGNFKIFLRDKFFNLFSEVLSFKFHKNFEEIFFVNKEERLSNIKWINAGVTRI